MAMPWHFYFMASLYILAGILHFVLPGLYKRILPSWARPKWLVVYGSGILEIAFGAALFLSEFRTFGLYGIIILLVMFLPVHAHMLRNARASMGIPAWILLMRIPFQGLLIYWAFSYLSY